jgi:hypothetical protein
LVHRRVRFLPPGRDEGPDPPDPVSFGRVLPNILALEVHRRANGEVLHTMAAPNPSEVGRIASALEHAFPGCRVEDDEVPCPLEEADLSRGRFARACVARAHHYYPLDLRANVDTAGLLIRGLAARRLVDTEVVLQVLARPVGGWEEPFYSSRYDKLDLALQGKHEPLLGDPWQHTPSEWEREMHRKVTTRHREAAVHTEIRLWALGASEDLVLSELRSWLSQWSSVNGGQWWTWQQIRNGLLLGRHRLEKTRPTFYHHDLRSFVGHKVRRDLSATEMAAVLPIPWKEHHPELSYVEATPRPFPRPTPALARRSTSLEVVPRPPLAASASSEVRAPFAFPPGTMDHLAVLGATGMGKSTFLQHLVAHVLEPDPWVRVVVVDPAGTLSAALKETIDTAAVGNTVEFDPAHLVYEDKGVRRVAPGFNLLELPPEAKKDPLVADRLSGLVANDLVRSFQNVWGEESVGARASYFISALVRGLLSQPGGNLMDLRDILVDKSVRERFARSLTDERLRSLVEKELPQFRIEEFVSTLDKAGRFGHSQVLRTALCQRYGATSFRDFFHHRLVLVNLARGVTGSDEARILGAAFLTHLWSEMTLRADPQHPVYLVVDEAQNFAIPSLCEMLSEGRKYGLRVILANQYLGQLPADLRAAMEGNVRNWAFFRMGVQDSKVAIDLTQAWKWKMTPQQLERLPPHRVLTSWDGKGSVSTVPPPPLVDPYIARHRVSSSERTTRLHSIVETSGASPFKVDRTDMAAVIAALERIGQYVPDVLTRSKLEVAAAMASLYRAEALGYVRIHRSFQLVEPTDLGLAFLAAVAAGRSTGNESEAHADLLARAAIYAKEWWYAAVEPVPQGASQEPLPDGRFIVDQATWDVEVECSNLSTKMSQVAKNLTKAARAGHGCLFVVPSRKDAERLATALPTQLPGAQVERDFVLLYRENGLHRYPGPDSRDLPMVLPALQATKEREGTPRETGDTPRLGDRGPLPQAVEAALAALRATGLEWVTGGQVLASLPEKERLLLSGGTGTKPSSRLGVVLHELEVTAEKRWDPDSKTMVRKYWIAGAQPTGAVVGASSSEPEATQGDE